MDLQQGFLQIWVFPEPVDRTSFQTKFWSYLLKVMHFGLRNAPTTFHRTMDMIFDRCRQFVSICLDDLIIHSRTMKEQLLNLCQVSFILRAERFYAKPSTCLFVASELKFVRVVVTANGISHLESKLNAVREWLTPLPPKISVHFLGIRGFHQRFLQNYCTLVPHPDGSFEQRCGMELECPTGTVFPIA